MHHEHLSLIDQLGSVNNGAGASIQQGYWNRIDLLQFSATDGCLGVLVCPVLFVKFVFPLQLRELLHQRKAHDH